MLELAHRVRAGADLLLERSDVRRQQAVQLELVALVLGERGPLVEQRVGEERRALEVGLDEVGHARAPAMTTSRTWFAP